MNKEKNMKARNSGAERNGATRRSEVVSAPGATIKVERFRLTQDERESLSVKRRLSDLKLSDLKEVA